MGVRGPYTVLRADLHGDMRAPEDRAVPDTARGERAGAARAERYGPAPLPAAPRQAQLAGVALVSMSN